MDNLSAYIAYGGACIIGIFTLFSLLMFVSMSSLREYFANGSTVPSSPSSSPSSSLPLPSKSQSLDTITHTSPALANLLATPVIFDGVKGPIQVDVLQRGAEEQISTSGSGLKPDNPNSSSNLNPNPTSTCPSCPVCPNRPNPNPNPQPHPQPNPHTTLPPTRHVQIYPYRGHPLLEL